jgi:hypothetical protein
MANSTFSSMTFDKNLEDCSVEELEAMAIKENDKERLGEILDERALQLDRAFKWTPEKKKRLLLLNDELIACFEKLRAEAEILFPLLQGRINAKDPFLHDFGIEAVVHPYFYEKSDDGNLVEKVDGIEGVLMYHWNDILLLNCSLSNSAEFNNSLYLDGDNWDEGILLRGEFGDCRISYAIHDLYDHARGWSMQDILNINHLWAELKITYQHFVNV